MISKAWQIGVAMCLLVLLPVALSARTWYITPDGTGDAPTIQAAIDSAAAGDSVMLADGTYSGEGNWGIEFRGKPISVISETRNPDSCIIAPWPHSGFLFISGEEPESVLDGVTVRNARRDNGAGLFLSGSSPTLSNLILQDNQAHYAGGGMACVAGSSPTLSDIIFRENFAMDGAGVYCEASSPSFVDVTFHANFTGMPGSGGGLVCVENSSPDLTNVIFLENFADGSGGAVLCGGASFPELTDVIFWHNVAMVDGGAISSSSGFTLTNCTIFYNGAGMFGGAIALWGSACASIQNTIIAQNSLPEAVFVGGSSSAQFSCSDIHGNQGGDWIGSIADQLGIEGNFSADPLFCDAPNGDFSLEDCSPCLPGNHPDGYDCGGAIGAFGEGCECGASTEPSTWGTIKAMYR